jgi:hypothetical protein
MTKRHQDRTIDVRMVCRAPSYSCIHVWQLFVLVTLLVLAEMLMGTQKQTRKSPGYDITGSVRNIKEVKGTIELCLIKHHATRVCREAEV